MQEQKMQDYSPFGIRLLDTFMWLSKTTLLAKFFDKLSISHTNWYSLSFKVTPHHLN